MKEMRPRILMLSHRNVANKILARCQWLEFEDLVREMDDVEMLTPARLEGFDKAYRLAARIGRRFPIALSPGVPITKVKNQYELFFSVCVFPSDLLFVNALKNWRENCGTAICWISEMLLSDFRYFKYFEKVISRFDHVFVACGQVVRKIQNIVRGNCYFMLPGVDAVAFCPFPEPPQRFIDVLSIGRRNENIHNYLISVAEKKKIFYIYDTTSGYGCKYGLTTTEPKQHRLLLANLAKRSRYFLVSPGKFDLPHLIGNEELVGSRYFEGAASGCLLIGPQPSNPEYKKHFFWPDAVVPIDLESDEVIKIVTEDDGKQERWRKARTNNIINTLLHHDWAYRWEKVLEVAGIEPRSQLLARKGLLRKLADKAK